MDTHSSFDDEFINEEVLEKPRVTRKSFPSLLIELHTLDLQQEIWTTDFRLAPFTREDIWNLQQEVKLLQLVFMLLLNNGLRSQSLDDIQTLAEKEAERIQKLAAASIPVRGGVKATLSYRHRWEDRFPVFLDTLHQKIKPQLKEFCVDLVDRLLQGNCSAGDYGIFAFIKVILLKLKQFMILKPNLIDPVKKQMHILEEMLNYAPIIARKMTNLDENLQNFFKFFEPWVKTAAAIVILYWVDENDEKPFVMVSSSLQKFNLSIIEYVDAYVVVLKALRPSNASEILVMRNTVEKFTEMILEKCIVSKDDCLDRFREGLAFWTALLVDPPKSDAEDEKLMCSKTHILLDQAKSLICSLCQKKLGKDIADNKNTLLSDFLEKINKSKAEVGQLQVHPVPGLSSNNVSKGNTRGNFDLLLVNLQKKFEIEAGLLPFEKHLIPVVHKELSLLRPFLLDIFELQDEHKELRDIWIQATTIAYIVDYITDFCLSSAEIPIWCNLMHLSNAIEKLQYIKAQVSKIQSDHMYNNIVTSAKLNSEHMISAPQEAYDIKDDFKVGFVEEERRIINLLVAGEARCNIVAVFGMPGQGKTHLAQRVFQHTRINHHFTKLAWCCISQSYDIKRVFRDILEDVGKTVRPESYQHLTHEDLADQLRKCLKGQRYLVVLDDMWDAKAWFDLQLSFPDDRNGSRILFTSRNRDVALKVKVYCSIVELNPLSFEESLNLLQMKVFHGHYCPPTLSEIGKTVAENCKGLPFVVVVVAGLLKKDKNVESWKQICESLKVLTASEGCMDIVELSYKHLPDYLKPCFLYLGAYREDEIIDVKQLMQFWIAEGFVQGDGIKTRKVVAKEYLMDLVSRSLISVAKISSRNEIKKCRVHDLLHQLCLIKMEEERFLLVLNEVSDFSYAINNYFCRIIVHDKWRPFLDSKPFGPGLRSLLVSVGRFAYASYTPGFLKEFKLIRVLDLTNAIVTKTGLDDIMQLIHLRLLAIVCKFPVPPSVLNLSRLEVLRYHAVERVTLPSVVIKMESLRHIFSRNCVIEYIEPYNKLVSDMSFPSENLETLTTVYFYDELSFKRVAQSIQNILKLGFKCSVCFRLSSYFKRLESLKLKVFRFHYFNQGKQVISPSTLDFPSTLKKLNLSLGNELSGAMISLIGKLSNLEVLKLNANLENDRWNVEDDEFLQLKYFDIKFSSVQEWNVSDESFTRLEQLIVRNCLKLGELPARFGSVITLRRIEVHKCSDSLSNC